MMTNKQLSISLSLQELIINITYIYSFIIIIIIIIQYLFTSHMGSNVIRFKFRMNMYLKQQQLFPVWFWHNPHFSFF